MRRGVTLVEVCVLAALALILIVPVAGLSSENLLTPDEIADRELMEGLCLDTLERLKSTPLDRPLPGGPPGPSGEAPPLSALLGPVELDPARTTLFDRVYLDRLAGLYASLVPSITRTPDPDDPSCFRLEVKIAWRDRRGTARVTREVRWCYAPVSEALEPEDP